MFKSSDAPKAGPTSTSSWLWRPLPGLFPLSLEVQSGRMASSSVDHERQQQKSERAFPTEIVTKRIYGWSWSRLNKRLVSRKHDSTQFPIYNSLASEASRASPLDTSVLAALHVTCRASGPNLGWNFGRAVVLWGTGFAHFPTEPCDYWVDIHERQCFPQEGRDQWSSACKVASQHQCKGQMKTLDDSSM